jgi:hypothetical protein
MIYNVRLMLWSSHLGIMEFLQNVPGSEVIRAVIARSSVFWDIALCIPLKVYLRFRGTCSLHHRVGKISQPGNQHEAGRTRLDSRLSYSSGTEDVTCSLEIYVNFQRIKLC